jgi:hypothetical protein
MPWKPTNSDIQRSTKVISVTIAFSKCQALARRHKTFQRLLSRIPSEEDLEQGCRGMGEGSTGRTGRQVVIPYNLIQI